MNLDNIFHISEEKPLDNLVSDGGFCGILLSIGCNYAQGYYYARPVDPEEFEVLSFVQEKAFWVDPSLQEEARRLNLPLGLNAPDREY